MRIRFSSWAAITRTFKILLVAAVLAPAALFAVIVAPGPLSDTKDIVIPRGAHVREIAGALMENGAIRSTLVFRFAARAIAFDQLVAGEYQIPPRASIADVVLMMHDGRSVVRLFTLPEGLTSFEAAALLNAAPAFEQLVTVVPPEGSLLPETYRYSYGDSRAELIARMQKSMQDALVTLWAARDPSVPLASPAQAVILASIVEKETGKPAERPRIAGVFYNRLHFHMRLQSDPTVIYAITKGESSKRDLSHDDLAFASPFNTYLNDGLPPEAICNPGRAALEAVLHPEANDFLYFVADGTGGHVFAKDLNEHNRNVAKWAQMRAKSP